MSDTEPETKRHKTDSPTGKYTSNYEESVFNNELILNYIFKNLTAKELRSISRVCKAWHKLTTKLSEQYSCVEDLFAISGLSNYMRNHSQRYSKLITLKDHENFEGIKCEIKRFLCCELKSVPSIALFFNSFRGLSQKQYSTFLNSPTVLTHLPRTCSIFSLSVNDTGVIGNDSVGPVETMQDHKFIHGISYLFLPDLSMHGCQIIPFKGCQSELCRYLNEEQITGHNVKGIITFVKFNPSASPDLSILKEILGKQTNRVAIGGIMVEQINISSNVDCKMVNTDESKKMIRADFSALMFCGDSVNCASLVINSGQVDKLRDLLSNFRKKLHFDPDRTDCEFFGFMFACAGRGFNTFNNLNLESDTIKEQFPNIKLYGIFGLGEIGTDYYSTYRSEVNLTYYTTVLFLVQIIKRKH